MDEKELIIGQNSYTFKTAMIDLDGWNFEEGFDFFINDEHKGSFLGELESKNIIQLLTLIIEQLANE